MVQTMIKFPNMRVELLDRLQLLADEKYQAKYWGSKEPHWDFGYIINFFFDDTALSEGGGKYVGMILENEYEAMLLDKICKNLRDLMRTYGNKQTESGKFYMNTAEWGRIVNDARQFLEYWKEPQVFK
jgi:hypothetical protein